MIKTGKNGRRLSVTTPEEVDSRMDTLIAGLTDDERELMEALTQDFGKDVPIGLQGDLIRHTYHTEPVSMEQFIEDPYYLGESCTTIYPAVKQDLIDLFSRNYREFLTTGSIGAGKCVSGRTEIYDTWNGRRIRIDELVNDDKILEVPTFDKKNGCVVNGSGYATQSGFKKTGFMRLDSGKVVEASKDHPVLTPFGWKKISTLKKGDFVATARSLPEPKKINDIDVDEIKWVAYMLGNGVFTQKNMSFTNQCDAVLDEFVEITKRLGDKNSKYNGCSFSKKVGKVTTICPLGVQWIRNKYNLTKRSDYKRIPSAFYGLSNEKLAIFFNRLWACDDGWVSRKSKRLWEIGIALDSEEFIRDIQELLLRFGIHSRTRYMKVFYKKDGERIYKEAWSLSISGKDNVIKFFINIGCVKGKESRCINAIRDLGRIKSNSNVDITPMDSILLSKLRKEIGPIKRTQYWPLVPKTQYMGYNKFNKFLNKYHLPRWCNWWGSVFWDKFLSFDEKNEVEPVFDLHVPGTVNFAVDGIIIHNSYSASIAICRILYELSCMISPQKTFGLSSGSEIVIPLISKNLTLAREVMKSAVDDKLKESPYFMTNFAPDFRKEYTILPHNIRVTIGSYGSDRILGTNVMSCVCDEMNFPPKRKGQQIATGFGQKVRSAHYDIVEKMYRGILRRIKSRFQKTGNAFPGMLILISSAATVESFTERKIRESKYDSDIFVRDHTIWTSKPRSDFSDEVFFILCSTSSTKSRILSPEECEKITDEYLDANDAFLMDIPIDFLEDFESNMEDALRDIAGFPTEAISQFIQRPKMIEVCTNNERIHPFSNEEWIAGSPGSFDWDTLCIQYERNLPGGFTETAWKPRRNSSCLRWCHIDTSISGDSSGFCVGHIERWVEVVRTDAEGYKSTDIAPFYVIDFMLRINPPPAEQIYMPDLRTMLYQFIDHGFRFAGFSTDTYQAVECHQQVKRKGISTKIISMDRSIEPYDELKSAFYEKRIEIYPYKPFIDEFKKLEYDRLVGKVDHPLAGEKDVADAVAGTCAGLKSASKNMPLHGSREKAAMRPHEHSWVTPLIPAEDVDIEEVRMMKESNGKEEVFMPIIFG